MSQDWPLTRLEEITRKIGSGATPRGGKSAYGDSGISLIRSLNVYDLHFDRNELAYINEKQAEKLANVKVEPSDVLLNITGASVARCCMVPLSILPARVNQHVSIVRANCELVDPHFLMYCLVSPQYKHHLLTLAQGGATREALTKDTISNFGIPLPPLEIQRKIAAVLSAYDDLIENNTRRIAILEEMARRLYREWFVHFRFPGHEDVEMVEVDGFGRVPRGWRIAKLGEACDLVMGQSPKSEYYNEEGIGLPFHQGVKDFGERFPTDRVYCTVENRIAEAGDILFSVRAPVGRINIANKKIVVGRGLSAIRSQTDHQAFIFQQLKDKFSEEDMMGGGTIFKSVTKQDMLDIELVMPTGDVLNRFEEIMKPSFRQLEVLTIKITNLRQTRDLLLPRLISGELDISKLDIANIS